MLEVLKIFFSQRGTSKWSIVSCIVVASIAEGFGLAVADALDERVGGQELPNNQESKSRRRGLARLELA